MTKRRPWHSLFALLLGVAVCAAVGAQTVDTRCLADGGIALCSQPTNVADPASAPVDTEMWTYNVCDLGIVCLAGSRLGQGAGRETDLRSRHRPRVDGFEQIVNSACQIGVTDSGWGQTIPSNILCWTGPPLAGTEAWSAISGKLSFTGLKPGPPAATCRGRRSSMPGSGGRSHLPGRTASGPKRTETSNAGSCRRNARSETRSATRSLCSTGASRNARSTTGHLAHPGGVEVERYYNSAGYFRFDVAPEKASDVWRTTWNRRILVAPAGGQCPCLFPARRWVAAGVRRHRAGDAKQSRWGGRASPTPDRWRGRDDRMAAHHREQRCRNLRCRRRVAFDRAAHGTNLRLDLCKRSARHRHRRVWRNSDVHVRRAGSPSAASWRRAIGCTPTSTTPWAA